MCSTLLEAAFDIAPSLRSWQVEPCKGRPTQSRVFEGKILPVLQWGGGIWNDGEIPHQLKCLWKGSGPLALIRPILPWNVLGSTSLRPGPLRLFTFIFSKTPPFLYFLLLYLFSLSHPFGCSVCFCFSCSRLLFQQSLY